MGAAGVHIVTPLLPSIRADGMMKTRNTLSLRRSDRHSYQKRRRHPFRLRRARPNAGNPVDGRATPRTRQAADNPSLPTPNQSFIGVGSEPTVTGRSQAGPKARPLAPPLTSLFSEVAARKPQQSVAPPHGQEKVQHTLRTGSLGLMRDNLSHRTTSLSVSTPNNIPVRLDTEHLNARRLEYPSTVALRPRIFSPPLSTVAIRLLRTLLKTAFAINLRPAPPLAPPSSTHPLAVPLSRHPPPTSPALLPPYSRSTALSFHRVSKTEFCSTKARPSKTATSASARKSCRPFQVPLYPGLVYRTVVCRKRYCPFKRTVVCRKRGCKAHFGSWSSRLGLSAPARIGRAIPASHDWLVDSTSRRARRLSLPFCDLFPQLSNSLSFLSLLFFYSSLRSLGSARRP